MQKTITILSGCLVLFAVLQATPVFAGAGCCPSKAAKADKASACGSSAGQADNATLKTCVVDGKSVALTVNADGSCTIPAGAVDATNAASGSKTCVIDGKTVVCTVNADGSCTVKGAAAADCHKPGTCGSKGAATSKAKDSATNSSTSQLKSAGL